MDRQDELLAREDGRYFAVDKVGTGIGSLATAERLGPDVVSFGLPSGPALFLSLAHRAFSQVRGVDPRNLFDEHEQGIWPDSQGRLFDYLENCIAHVIFAFTAIESFANEVIPPTFTYARQREGRTENLTKDDVERWVGLDEKLDKILPTIHSVPSPKGSERWEAYRLLKRVRDRLIHLKTIDRRSSGPEDETVWGTLLNSHGRAWCDEAHAMIAHFKPAIENRRWHSKYPYGRQP